MEAKNVHCFIRNISKNMKRNNEKCNCSLHEYHYMYGALYSRLEKKQVSIDSRLTTLAHKN